MDLHLNINNMKALKRLSFNHVDSIWEDANFWHNVNPFFWIFLLIFTGLYGLYKLLCIERMVNHLKFAHYMKYKLPKSSEEELRNIVKNVERLISGYSEKEFIQNYPREYDAYVYAKLKINYFDERREKEKQHQIEVFEAEAKRLLEEYGRKKALIIVKEILKADVSGTYYWGEVHKILHKFNKIMES